MPTKPHLQLGQKGKGAGRKKRRNPPAPRVPKPVPGPIPTQLPEVSGYPKTPEPGPNFLPNTPGWEDARAKLSGQLLGAQTDYTTGVANVGAAKDLALARNTTDMGYADNARKEGLADRGVFDSSINPYTYNRDIATPYGRRTQDIGIQAGSQYADLSKMLGQANLDYQTQLQDALQQRELYAAENSYYGTPWGDYTIPDQPNFIPSYEPPTGPRKVGKKKKKRNAKKPGGRR